MTKKRCDRDSCENPVESDELHPCPFDEEINDNHDARCNCCEECTNECAMDI